MNPEQIAFLWPWAFAALPLPLLAYWLLPRAPQGPGTALRIPFFAAITAAVGDPGGRRRQGVWALVPALLAWALLVTAAARPQWLGEPVTLPQQGRDLMLAVDLSESMATEDMVVGNKAVDRLTAVKAVAGDFIERRAGDRLGLILFGSQAYPQAPLTFDRATVRALLFESAIGLAGKATAIGDAIALAVKRLRDTPSGTPGTEGPSDRILILLTDGANTAGTLEPLKAAELAAQAGIRIYTIGVGAEPRRAFGLAMGGAEIDEPTLEAIAKATGGHFFRARDLGGLQAIYSALDEMEPRVSADQSFRPVRDLFQWPLGLALALSALVGVWPWLVRLQHSPARATATATVKGQRNMRPMPGAMPAPKGLDIAAQGATGLADRVHEWTGRGDWAMPAPKGRDIPAQGAALGGQGKGVQP